MANRRVIIFAHYNSRNIVSDYVLYHLVALKAVSDRLVFVTTSLVSEHDLVKLDNIVDNIIQRENIGYDFFSYKAGIEEAMKGCFDELVIVNDSVYGPLKCLEELFQTMSGTADFWGITKSDLIETHLQSYFICFSKKVFMSGAFQSFWRDIKVQAEKLDIVRHHEVGLSTTLIEEGFSFSAACDADLDFIKVFLRKIRRLKNIPLSQIIRKLLNRSSVENLKVKNIDKSHLLWKELILEANMPYLKVSLIRDNPLNINIRDYEDILVSNTDYPVNIIKKHLKEIGE